MVVSVKFFAILAAYIAEAYGAPTAPAPADFTPNPMPGGGGNKFKDSPHFRVYGYSTDAAANSAIKSLEAAYSCFVDDLGWRSTGLSFNTENDTGPYYKVNVYSVASLPGAAANTGTHGGTGLSFLNVVAQYMNEPSVTVHEFGVSSS
jgi:hypothetical protein